MGHLRENKKKFWRRKIKIIPKNPNKADLVVRAQQLFFAQPHGIWEEKKNKVWDVLACTDAVSHIMHVCITGTPESENILQPTQQDVYT